MRWANFFHIYQPPGWDDDSIRRVAAESYRPFLAILKRHPGVRVTLHIAGSLTEQLMSLSVSHVIDDLRELVGRGQIELTGGAMYHPILPLLPIDEIRRQIDLQDQFHRQVFGTSYHPKGFFAPEMAYESMLEPILAERGYEWIILDEYAYDGHSGHVSPNIGYRTVDGLGLVFRHRGLSDYLSFEADLRHPEAAVEQLFADYRIKASALVTAMDGENLGHHRHGVDRLWEQLVTRPGVETITIAEYRKILPAQKTIKPVPCSWSSQEVDINSGIPYGLWNHPDNAIHQLQWQLTQIVLRTVSAAVDDPSYAAARALLDQHLSSDKYWWASASPWWDPSIIIRETQKLADAVSPLQTLRGAAKNEVERYMNKISSTVALWDKTGIARRRQQGYLHHTGRVHFMAGQQVS